MVSAFRFFKHGLIICVLQTWPPHLCSSNMVSSFVFFKHGLVICILQTWPPHIVLFEHGLPVSSLPHVCSLIMASSCAFSKHVLLYLFCLNGLLCVFFKHDLPMHVLSTLPPHVCSVNIASSCVFCKHDLLCVYS
jgi:hypothetical protein